MVLLGPYKSLFVVKNSNGSLWVLISPYSSLLVSNGTLWVLISPCASISVLKGPYRSLRVLVHPYVSL